MAKEIEHFISEMKTDLKLCTTSFSVVTLPLFSAWSRLSSRYMHTALRQQKRMSPTLTDCVFLIKKHFMCVEQSTGTTVMYGEVKILMMLLNMSMIY